MISFSLRLQPNFRSQEIGNDSDVQIGLEMKAEIGSFLSFEIRCKMGKLSFEECTPTLLFVQGLN